MMTPEQCEIVRLRGLLETERRIARTDPLTGLGNRRSFDEAIAQAVCEKKPFGIIVFDAANLHTANLVRGHAGGDELLRQISSVIRLEADSAYRLGGDEFAVILSGVQELSDARNVCVRVEKSVPRIKLGDAASMFLVGGCAVYQPSDSIAAAIAEAYHQCGVRKQTIKRFYGEAQTRNEAEESCFRMSAKPLEAPGDRASSDKDL